MSDLTAFLAARLAADEAEADEVHQPRTCGVMTVCGFTGDPVDCTCGEPDRVRREVAAMRAILAEHAPGYPVTYPKPSGQPTCGVCHAGGWDWDPADWPCPTVRHLAAAWSDHPDYRAEWKPLVNR